MMNKATRKIGPLNPIHQSCWLGMLGMVMILGGCSLVMSSVTTNMAQDLTTAVMDQNDLALVRDGAPAYLLLIDGLLNDDPRNQRLLQSAAMLYTTYAEVFVDDSARARRLTDRALQYAQTAICEGRKVACALKTIQPFKAFTEVIEQMGPKDVPNLFTMGSTWASWIQAHQEDWNAVAEIARVEVIMQRVIMLDETYQNGAAHIYMGVLQTLIPPAMGGKPENGKMHFEKAWALSGQSNLMAKVLIAERYARITFDRDTHDRLLKEVIGADPAIAGFVLVNTLAQQKATELLTGSQAYFE
jgi:hypothetical protein